MAKKAAAESKPTRKVSQAPARSVAVARASAAPAAAAIEPSHEQIAARAFELFMQRGGGDGSDMNDWLRAERELRAHN